MSTASPRDIITEALDPAVKAAMDEHVLKVCRALGEILSARGYTIAPPGYRVVREGDLDAATVERCAHVAENSDYFPSEGDSIAASIRALIGEAK